MYEVTRFVTQIVRDFTDTTVHSSQIFRLTSDYPPGPRTFYIIVLSCFVNSDTGRVPSRVPELRPTFRHPAQKDRNPARTTQGCPKWRVSSSRSCEISQTALFTDRQPWRRVSAQSCCGVPSGTIPSVRARKISFQLLPCSRESFTSFKSCLVWALVTSYSSTTPSFNIWSSHTIT